VFFRFDVAFQAFADVADGGKRELAQAVDQRIRLRGGLPEVSEPAGFVDGNRNERLYEVGFGLREVRDTERGKRVGFCVPPLVGLVSVLVVGLVVYSSKCWSISRASSSVSP
jgi:hypothetical protein